MVNLNHILKRRNCPTLEHQLYDDIEEAMEFQEQEYGKFPPRDHLFLWEDDPDTYKANPVINNLFEHYLTFFEKGIDYTSDGKTWNVYPTGSVLWYFNEAFSICTKLSIDPYPEQYFLDEYYRDIGGNCTPIERYFILSIVYSLLAVNWKVRRQHLKMVDVLYNFLSKGCPYSVMVKSIEFIAKTYTDSNAIDYEFRPIIDRWGYTLLKVDEGLPTDDEEQNDLFVQMRKKVCENGIKYAKMFNVMPRSNPPEELLIEEAQSYWSKLRVKGLIIADGYALAAGTSPYDATIIADHFSGVLGIKNKWKVFEALWGLNNMAQKLGDIRKGTANVPHQREINEIFGVIPKPVEKLR